MNPFEIFKIKESYFIDKLELEKKYVTLLAKHHPDNFEGKESLFASSFCVKINDAYFVLKDDILRAKIILEKNKIIIDGDGKNINISKNFIETVMLLNEKLLENKEKTLIEIDAMIDESFKLLECMFEICDFQKAGEVLLKVIYLQGIKKHNLILK